MSDAYEREQYVTLRSLDTLEHRQRYQDHPPSIHFYEANMGLRNGTLTTVL
jgi:hypothetical protein